MKMPPHTRSGMASLTMMGLIVGVLLVTGAGQYLWRNATQIGAHCRNAMLSIEFHAGLDVCSSIGHQVVSFQRYLEQQVGASKFGDTMNLEEFSGYIARQFAGQTIGFRAPQLAGFINPSLLNAPSANGASAFNLSLTQGAYGSKLLQSGQSAQGLKYLQSSAAMGDAGLLSQLQLGSAYAKGTGGLPANAARSNQYYRQAYQSLQNLQRSNNRQSQALLQALPVPPQQLQNQLTHLLPRATP